MAPRVAPGGRSIPAHRRDDLISPHDHPHQPAGRRRDPECPDHRTTCCVTPTRYPDRAALIDGPTGRVITFAELQRADPPVRRWPGGARLRPGRHARADGAEHPRVRDRLPRRRRRRRHGHHDQPDLRRRRGPLPAPGRRRLDADHDRDVRRDGDAQAIEGTDIDRGADARRRRGHGQRASSCSATRSSRCRSTSPTTSWCSPTRRAPPGCRRA